MRGEDQFGAFRFRLIESCESVANALRNRLDEFRMRMPRLGIFDLRRVRTDFRSRILDSGLITLPTRFASMRRQNESENSTCAAAREVAHRLNEIRIPVAHADDDGNVDAVATQPHAQSVGLAHRV